MRFPWENVILCGRKSSDSSFFDNYLPLDIFKKIFYITLKLNMKSVFVSKRSKKNGTLIFCPYEKRSHNEFIFFSQKKCCIDIFVNN